MKPNNNQFVNDLLHGEQRVLVLVGCVAAFLLMSAVVVTWIATSQFSALMILLLGGLALIVAIGLQQRIWIMLLVTWAMSGQTALTSLPLSPRDATIVIVAGVGFFYLILSGKRRLWPWKPLDIVILIFVVYIGITFILHPAGLRVFGSDVIGGRAYFTAALAIVAYVTLVRLPESPQWVGKAPYFLLIGYGVIAGLYLVSYVAPSVAMKMPYLYAAMDIGGFFAGGSLALSEVPRLQQLTPFGGMLVLVLCARYRPLTLLNPLKGRFWVFLCACVCLFAGGFRGTFLGAIVSCGIGTILRRQWRDLAVLAVAGVVLLGGLVLLQGRVVNLPRPMQRTLSFLPGQWDPIVMEDARGSSESRFEWWQQIWESGSGGLIKNWWLGDGLGISTEDWLLANTSSSKDVFIIMGTYHNGPLTTILCVGIVGLVLLYILMIYGAVLAVRYVRLCRGTPLEMLSVFVAIWLVYRPIVFVLIFGEFRTDLPEMLLYLGLLRLIMRVSDQGGLRANLQVSLGSQKPAKELNRL